MPQPLWKKDNDSITISDNHGNSISLTRGGFERLMLRAQVSLHDDIRKGIASENEKKLTNTIKLVKATFFTN